MSEEPDELYLEESDIVNVLRKTQDGWSHKWMTVVKLNRIIIITRLFSLFGHLTASRNTSLIQASYKVYVYFVVNYNVIISNLLFYAEYMTP